MNLIVDIGNTRVKLAVFDSQILVYNGVSTLSEAKKEIEKIFELHNISAAIIGTVVTEFNEVLEIISNKITNVLIFSPNSKTPVTNLYKTVGTLGSDRLSAVVGAYSLYKQENVLVIDAGTCIKYNFLNKNGEYLGGSISPGIEMRFKAMHHYTSKLPLVNFNENFDSLIGDSTETSILSGVQTATVAEVEMMINYYQAKYSDLKIVITGGNGAFLANKIKKHIFAEPYLVLIGLNEILRYNS